MPANIPQQDIQDTDVLPPLANAVMATLWIVLFGGRWLVVPLLQAAGMLTPEQVQAWDEGILQKTYLILLSITCIVPALRATRQAQKRSQSHPPGLPIHPTHPGLPTQSDNKRDDTRD